MHINGSNAVYTMFLGSVKGTGYPIHFPVSPSLPFPCVTVCHQVSTGLYIRAVHDGRCWKVNIFRLTGIRCVTAHPGHANPFPDRVKPHNLKGVTLKCYPSSRGVHPETQLSAVTLGQWSSNSVTSVETGESLYYGLRKYSMVNVKVTLEYATKARRGSRCIALLLL
jgi:hypothetical protein